MSEHSILPPSGAAIWVKCSQWPAMNKKFVKEETEDAKEGTAAHWVNYEIMHGRAVKLGDLAPNGVVITDEMLEGAELWVKTIYTHINAPLNALMMERKVHIPRVHEKCFGTLDFGYFDKSHNTLFLKEYKFGFEFVDEFENWQNMAYTSGLLDELFPDYDYSNVLIDIEIIQPRCYHRAPVRSWQIKAKDLRPYVNILANMAEEALSSNAKATTNEGCKHCPGRHDCEALQKATYSDVEVSLKSTGLNLSPSAASLELRMLERALNRLSARVEGLREEVLVMLKQGKQVPHHALEQTIGRINWSIEPDEVIMLGELMGINLTKPATLTPKQAIAAGMIEELVNSNVTPPTTGVKLIPFNSNKARKVFG